MSANGRVKPDSVIVSGVEVKYSIGHYVLRSYSGTTSIWTRIDGNATEALAALKTAQQKAVALVNAEAAGLDVAEEDEQVTLDAMRKRYVEAAEARGAMEAAEVVNRAVGELIHTAKAKYVHQLKREDMTRYHAALRKRGLADRTVANRHTNVRSFVLFAGLDADEVCGPAPRYEEEAVEIFEADELRPFFDSLTKEYDQLLFDTLLTLGLREQEAMHLDWINLNTKAKTVRVRSNPKWGFKVKDAEQRDIPISADLLDRLLAYRDKVPNHRLVFGRRGGMMDAPDGHLLRRLKNLVRDAGLNCDHCEKCVDRKECERWYLHKFRATYITTLLRNGVDLRTVMKFSGHSDLESVMRYLRPAEGKEVQAKVNAIQWR
jgi:integrase